MNRVPAIACLLLLGLIVPVVPASATESADKRQFGVLYTAWIKPGRKDAKVRIRLTKHPEWVHWMHFNAGAPKYSKFQGTGKIEVQKNKVLWHPPKQDAWLEYRVVLERQRASGRYDRRIADDWALFRAADLVPRAHVSVEDFTESRAKLDLRVPEDWSVATTFPRYESGRFRIDNPERLFDRPSGWVLAGRLGTRRETIGNTQVTVSAPVGEGLRRMDLLAFFRWTLPTLQKLFPEFPERLLIVGAGDPMWRGALSGRNSLYVHTDRPMISENGTSTFIHELVHVAMRARSAPGADWIVEGLAEYYSLEVLRRSGTLSEKRYRKAHAKLAEWGEEAASLEVKNSKGPVTARAVGVLRETDQRIRKASGGARSLDDVVRVLAAENKPVTRKRFDELVTRMSR